MADLPKIGLDIGSTTIKAVELTPVGKGWKLLPAVLTPAVGEVTAGRAEGPPAASSLITH